MPITYVFENIRSTNDNDYLLKIANAPLNETEYIEFVIKDKYYTKGYIKYENYMVQILDIGGVKIDEINQQTKIKWSYLDQVELFTNIECNEDDGCEFIKTKSQSNTEFTGEVQTELRNYTGIQNLLFSVKNAKKITIICKNCEKDINYPLYVLSSIGGLIVILSFCAFMFNKGKFPKCAGFNIVDDGKWVALIIFGLQVYDFYSDINLSIEISSRDDFLQDIIILIAGLGSIFFILVPYIANLIIAARIKDIIKGNAAAKGWFQYNTPIFTVLVVLSGGAHAALSLVSSQIFGLTIMSCGLTQYELNKLGKLKVIGTVLIENIPQLICQILYTTRLDGNITDAVKLAFVASSLSVIASTLSYLIEKDTSDTSAVQYYVSTQCAFRLDKEDSNYHEGTLMSIKKQHSRAFSTTKEYDEIKEDEKNDEALSNECIITNEEKQNIIDNRGRTERLGENLAEVFGIPTKNIEVGHSMLTKRGVITHIIHYVYDEDLETMEEELMIENITPRLFVSKLFDLLQVDIHRVFKDHFQLNDDFQVSFNCRLGIIKRTLVQQNNINNENQNKMNLNRVTSRRNIVLKQMISRHLSHSNMLQQTNLELNAINTLRKLFVDKQKNTVNEQLNLCSTLIKKINNDMIKPVHLESSMKHINKLDDTNDDIEIDKLILINGLEKAISNDVVHDELDLQIEMGVLNPQISTAI